MKEAFDAGYDLDVTLKSVTEEGTTVGRQDILEMGERHIIVLREAVAVRPWADILYVSGDVEAAGSREAVSTDPQALSYIIFR